MGARKPANAQILSLAAALFLTACATSTSPPPTPGPPEAGVTPPPITDPRAMPDAATLALYRTWMEEGRLAHPYAESVDRMYAVMMCESEGRAQVVNPAGPYTGLFQYARRTWGDTWNTYRDKGMLDPKAQIFATALAWQLKMQRHWGCYSKTR